MTYPELDKFHCQYQEQSHRNSLPKNEHNSYHTHIIEKFMTVADFKVFNKKYQKAKVPNAYNLYHGYEFLELMRKTVDERLLVHGLIDKSQLYTRKSKI